MKFIATVILACILSGSIAYGIAASKNASAAGSGTESVYDRIMRTREVRCGYVNYPPLLMKDPNTGEFSGVGVDIMKRIAEILKVKLVWAQETSWANYIEDLKNNRFDVLCTLDFFLPEYAGRTEVTAPLFYTGIDVYKRADDTRFIEGFRQFNDPNVTISAIDGSISMLIGNTDYPAAKVVSMPAMTDYSAILMNVLDKKADVTFMDRSTANAFIKNNPGKLVDISGGHPLRIFAYFIPFKIGEAKLKSTMNGLIDVLLNNGEIDKILDRYEQGVPSFYRVAKGYR